MEIYPISKEWNQKNCSGKESVENVYFPERCSLKITNSGFFYQKRTCSEDKKLSFYKCKEKDCFNVENMNHGSRVL